MVISSSSELNISILLSSIAEMLLEDACTVTSELEFPSCYNGLGDGLIIIISMV